MNTRTCAACGRIAIWVLVATVVLPGAAFAQHAGHGGGHNSGAVHVGVSYGGAPRTYYGGPNYAAHYYAGPHYYAPRYYSSRYYGYGHYGPGFYGYRNGYGYGYSHSYYAPYWYGGLAIGAFVATLPVYYNTYWWGGVPYYYYDNTYYRWDSRVREYEVVAPPQNAQASQAPSSSTLYAYPTKGQSDEQRKTDRYECHRWAAEQSGFDPTPDTASQTPQNQDQSKRVDYLRAETACLSGRGYSVR